MRGVVLLVIALAVAVAAASFQVARSEAVTSPGVYSGLGSQRLPVVLTVAQDGKTLGVDVDWVARCSGDDRRPHLPIAALLRVEMATGRVSTTPAFAGAPSNVVAGESAAWILDTYERTLIRVAR